MAEIPDKNGVHPTDYQEEDYSNLRLEHLLLALAAIQTAILIIAQLS